MSKLLLIQSELKAPKSQFNSFGKYNYRSCEDILEALKPLLFKHNASLILDDEVIEVGNRIYVKATAMFKAGDEEVSVSAFAREEETKKGMDASQITGTASSYSRKYALNGLFLIDDTKDSDATNDHGKGEVKDDKPWYNDFESHKEMMLSGIKSGEKTAQSIIENLEKKFKLSKEVKQKIEGLK